MTELFGLPDDRFGGLKRARLIQLNADSDIAAFALLPGARIMPDGVDADTVTAEINASVAGRTFTYSQTAVVEDGSVSLIVPYAGEYEIAGETVTVSMAAVEDGGTVAG